MILEQLGVYGWPEQDENLLLASLLTGDPLLLIGRHGSAKTSLAQALAGTLDVSFVAYDASKSLFDDVLGYPDIERLRQGVVQYIGSEVTIWNQQFVLIDELNRALPDLQSKWLEIIRSRRIMGFQTDVKWVWAAMNPMIYSATQTLDEALVGRFALFVYPPDVLEMEERDRVRVATHRNGDDAPALHYWRKVDEHEPAASTPSDDGNGVGLLLTDAAKHFMGLADQIASLGQFLARFADLLNRETKGELQLDGRRLGFMFRNILAVRSIQIAKCETYADELPDFADSARYAVLSSIPVGVNDGGIDREETQHKVEVVFDLLGDFFRQGADLERVNTVYELFTTPNLLTKAEILLRGDVSDLAKTKAWRDLIAGDVDITPLAYLALRVEACRPGTVPQEMIDGLGERIAPLNLSSTSVGSLKGESIEYLEEVEALLARYDDLEKLIAISHVRRLATDEGLTPAKIEHVAQQIERDIGTFRRLLGAEDAQAA